MKDTAIIRIISKIHVSIVTFLSIIGLTFLLSYLLLQKGIVVERLLLPGFKIQQLYIKWNEKLSLTANEIIVTKSNISEKKNFTPAIIKKTFGIIKHFDDWIESVNINLIQFGDTNVTFSYRYAEQGNLKFHSPDLKANALLTWNEHYFLADLTMYDTQRDIEIEGNSVVDLETLTSYSKLKIIPVQSADFTLFLEADQHELSFALKSNRPITDLRPIVHLFKLDKAITPWIVDYSFGSTFILHTMTGSLTYDNPGQLLNTLYASATYNDFIYKFQPGLPPIRTSHTDFLFQNGVLNIIPKNAYYCDQRTGDSWLDIDFNPDKEPVLNAYVITTSRLDKDLVNLLDYFKIPLPFLQSKGKTRANLTLNIPLLSVDVKANGDFYIDEGEVLYEGIPLQITNSAIQLNNSKVTVDKVNLGYEDILRATAEGVMNFGKGKTNLKIQAEKVNLNIGDSHLALDNNATHLMIDYKLSSKREFISAGPSEWLIDNKKIVVEPFSAPFNFNTASIMLPSIFASVENIADLTINGPVELKKKKAALEVDILKFNFNGLALNQSHFPLSIQYDQDLNISSHQNVHWKFDNTNITFTPSKLTINDEGITIVKNHFDIEDIMESELEGFYSFSKKMGTFKLHNFTFYNESVGNLFKSDKEIPVTVLLDKKDIYATVPSLALNARTKRDGWKLSFSDFEKLAEHSTFMRDYNLTDGALTVETTTGSQPYSIKGNINYPYPLLVHKNVPEHNLTFSGTFENNLTQLNIDEKMKIVIGKQINILSDGIGYNPSALGDFIKDHPNSDSNETDIPNISIIANNSYIYFFDKSQALADTITVDMRDKNITASLLYKDGMAIFELNDDTFYASGQKFDDEFMTTLFATSTFEGGSMLFNIDGTLDYANGILYIEDTIMKDYKTLNNILAFINTVPSLVTFSLPSYATKGVTVKDAYTKFTHKNDKTYFETIRINTPEMKIVGSGITDYPNNAIDMNMTFKTDLGTTVSKIPLVGYLLLGKDGSIATAFKVTGRLDDPTVKTQTVQDVVTAPFNIIKRAITLPFWIFSSDKNE